MSRLFYHTMQDNQGNLLFGVTGTMRLAGTGTLATIYGDEALTIPIPNPMTNHVSFGSFKCYLGAGSYDFYMAKAGYTFETLTGVQGGGSIAGQDAGNVAITGGSITGLNAFTVDPSTLMVDSAAHGVGIGTNGASGYKLAVVGTHWQNGNMGVVALPTAIERLKIDYLKASIAGITLHPTDNDTGGFPALSFINTTSVSVGQIWTNATTTSYNTTSDARLKHDVDDLTGELALVKALRPVRFRWLADDSPGVGFLASEVAAHVQGVITGEADAVNEDGSILPQMIDYSKMVPFLVGACKTLAAQVESLTERLVVLEDALGI